MRLDVSVAHAACSRVPCLVKATEGVVLAGLGRGVSTSPILFGCFQGAAFGTPSDPGRSKSQIGNEGFRFRLVTEVAAVGRARRLCLAVVLDVHVAGRPYRDIGLGSRRK